MGAKVESKGYVPGYHSMRDPNEDSSSSSWSLFGDKGIKNGPYYNGFMPKNIIDGHPEYDKDALKQKMLEHEATFKNQVFELHRLYRVQRDMMEEVKRKGLHRRASLEPSSSSTFHGSQVPLEDAWKWHMAGFPLPNAVYGTSISPMSCTKGYDMETGRSPFRNVSTSKDADALDSRPFKVRKKLFDLQLPADEYVDTEEGKHGNHESDRESSMNLPIGGLTGVKTDGRIDTSASASSLKNSVVLADLNEPIQIEEETTPSSVGYMGHISMNGECNGINQPVKLKAGNFTGEPMYIHDGFLKRPTTENGVNERIHQTHIYKAAPGQSHVSGVCQGLQRDRWSARHPHGFYPDGYDNSNNRHLKAPDTCPFVRSSSFASSWAHSVSSWAKSTSSFTQKMTTFESSSNPVAEKDKNLHNGFYCGSGSGSSKLNVHSASVGFEYLKCSRGDNVASDSATNHGFGNYVKGLGRLNSKPALDINLNEVMSSEEAITLQDLNAVDGKNIVEDHLSALPWLKRKSNHGKEASSARRSELLGNFTNLQASSNQLYTNSITIRDLNQPFTSDCENTRKKDTVFPVFETGTLENKPSSQVSTLASVDCSSSGKSAVSERKKRLMIDINLECEPDEQIPAEELTEKKEREKSSTRIRDEIDLNSCASDWEDPSTLTSESKSVIVKRTFEIDLEAPAFPEIEDDDNMPSRESQPNEVILPSVENIAGQIQDDIDTNAAEALISISSSCPQIQPENSICLPTEASLEDSLLWFVDACAHELLNVTENGSLCKRCSEIPEEVDEFELMTLQIEETKEEDYMPTPFIPEAPKVEETRANTTRPRRGQARRGRPRNFQRDILPGLTSLSRHEMTEDLQTFGGMMRATGHSWNMGSTGRNGTRNRGGRGRRRAIFKPEPLVALPTPVCSDGPSMQKLNVSEANLEDSSSLTGWGKTTRRPRRQRCPPAGNTPTVVLT